MRILVTGVSGFIGSHLAKRLLESGNQVIGIDNFDPSHATVLKQRNLDAFSPSAQFRLHRGDVRNVRSLEKKLAATPGGEVDILIHLAARVGVRRSLRAPLAYTNTNVGGTVATLELARRLGVTRFVFASSSSVYGNSRLLPFSENDPADHPLSPYAASKRAAELVCHTYSVLHGLSVVCLRMFSVYGPRQPPGQVIHEFARLLIDGEPIQVFGDGRSERDYTYIDDIVQGIEGAIALTGESPGGFAIINLGKGEAVSLCRLIQLLSTCLRVEYRVDWVGPQPGEVVRTQANIARARALLGYNPAIEIEEGITRYVRWLRTGTE